MVADTRVQLYPLTRRPFGFAVDLAIFGPSTTPVPAAACALLRAWLAAAGLGGAAAAQPYVFVLGSGRCDDVDHSFSRKQLWNPKNAINPLKKLIPGAGDAFALSGMLGGPPKTTATDEGPEATTRSVRASAVDAWTALPLAGPMVSAMVVASEFPDVGVSVSCRICGAGRSSSGISASACCRRDSSARSRNLQQHIKGTSYSQKMAAPGVSISPGVKH